MNSKEKTRRKLLHSVMNKAWQIYRKAYQEIVVGLCSSNIIGSVLLLATYLFKQKSVVKPQG